MHHKNDIIPFQVILALFAVFRTRDLTRDQTRDLTRDLTHDLTRDLRFRNYRSRSQRYEVPDGDLDASLVQWIFST